MALAGSSVKYLPGVWGCIELPLTTKVKDKHILIQLILSSWIGLRKERRGFPPLTSWEQIAVFMPISVKAWWEAVLFMLVSVTLLPAVSTGLHPLSGKEAKEDLPNLWLPHLRPEVIFQLP